MKRGTSIFIALGVYFSADVCLLRAQTEQSIGFTQSIKPILANKCFACHGPDQQKAGLRLDEAESAYRTLESGDRAIVPNQAEASLVVDRIFTDDPEALMPPPEKDNPLSAAEKDLLRKWIDQGAGYEKHWAYKPPKRPESPVVQSKEWSRTAIDLHVLANMEHEGLQPSPEADPYVLLRRVYLDLIGLPPTPDQIEQYIQDPRPNRYEHLVNELLMSPAYGERWARHWLDLARFADTNGYEKDRYRSIWPFRDWVINALNEGMPFDEFSIKQLAGDMLPNATEADRVATGFHRNTMMNEEGGIDIEEFRFESIVDRVNTTGTTWMGLAMGCAQCHGHKFDPVSHTEYWQLFAIFNNADEPEIDLHDPVIADQRAQIQSKIQQLTKSLKNQFPNQPGDQEEAIGTQFAEGQYYQQRFDQWLESAVGRAVGWTVLKPGSLHSKFHATLTTLPDQSVLASGDKPNRDIYTIELTCDLPFITGFRLEALAHPSLPDGGPGRAHFFQTGDFLLSEFIVETPDDQGGWVRHAFDKATDSHHKDKHEASKSLDGLLDTGWQIGGRTGEDHQAVFALKEAIQRDGEPIRVRITLDQSFIHQVTIGRFRLSSTGDDRPEASGMPADVEALLAGGAKEWEATDMALLEGQFHREAPELEGARKEIITLRRKLPSFPTTMVMLERKPEHTRTTFRRHRGEFLKPREEVGPGVPDMFHDWPEGRPVNRLTFARWLFEPGNPLTARVVMNRTWQAFFGKGIVTTPEDFGLQGAMPTQPDVLDWLAVEFEQSGWDMKHMHRLIVNSATYRQSSKLSEALLEKDPENRWLARGPRFRVDAETVRDIALHASGLLEQTIGGPSVFPPQPAGVGDLAYGGPGYKESEGADRYRRGLYTYWKRAVPYPGFMTFDAPNPERTCARRIRSNTPLQALTLLNDEIYVEAASSLAKRLLNDQALSDEERVGEAWMRLVGRPVSSAARQQILNYLQGEAVKLSQAPETVKQLTGVKQVTDATVRLAAWTLTCRVLLNLDEVITKS
jgi:cytochrome c553